MIAGKILAESRLLRSLVSGIVGFTVYGGWAYAVNLDHGDAVALRSGLIQGTYSLGLTMSLTLLIDYLLVRFKHLSSIAQLVCTTAFSSLLAFCLAYGIHWLAHTPTILITILPGFFIGSIYGLIYAVGVQKLLASTEVWVIQSINKDYQ